MLRRLILFLIVGALVFVGVKIWRRYRRLLPPMVPPGWKLLAAEDAQLATALDLRTRLFRLIRRHRAINRRQLQQDVHAVVAALHAQIVLRRDLDGHLEMLQSDAAALEDAQRVAHRATMAQLGERAQALREETERAITGLRQVYLDLLAAYEKSEDGGAEAGARTQSLLEDLREQAAAEREVRETLASVREG